MHTEPHLAWARPGWGWVSTFLSLPGHPALPYLREWRLEQLIFQAGRYQGSLPWLSLDVLSTEYFHSVG